MLATTDLASAVARYAERFHAEIGDDHHVASPLGAWLLLALAAPAARGSDRAALEDVLGVDAEVAAATAAELLADPHPLVLAAAAVWHRPEFETDALTGWLGALPEEVETGRIPTQAGADEWAREHTLELIERFPIEITRDVVLLLASALATKVSWLVPFELAPADALGRTSPWATRLHRVLRTPPHAQVFIAPSERAGDVGVHTAIARDGRQGLQGLNVTSVIGDRSASRGDVLAAAYEIATRAVAEYHGRRSLFDLPLGDGPAWTIAERPFEVDDADAEEYVAVLPAWSASSDHDLSAPRLGFPSAKSALSALLPDGPEGYRFEARQSAVARYSRTGFEAAAVTAFAIMTSLRAPSSGLRRIATVRFGHPFAVVAVALDARSDPGTHEIQYGPWHGVPVFSAWITEPEDADEGEGA